MIFAAVRELQSLRTEGFHCSMDLRLRNIYSKLEKSGLDGLIVSSPANISYLAKLASRDSYFIVSKKGNIYLTDSRYIEEVKLTLGRKAEIRKINGSAFKLIADSCLDLTLKRVGFEERLLPFAEHAKIKEGLKKRAALVPTHGLVEELRQIKEPQEIENIKKAVRITRDALKFASRFIAPGKKEIEVVAELERFIRYKGGSKSAFDIIVASGPNSSFPHHISSERKIRNNEPVLIDIGVEYSGYKSDLTRVFFLGRMNALVRKIYDIVLQAQRRAIKSIKPSQVIAEVDATARRYITQKGYGDFFSHSLGHGVGLEVHEDPHISGKERAALSAGMVFTVEPAVYLPNKFGIRIEDMVLVTKEKYEVISGTVN